MSAGEFQSTKYESNSGRIYPAKTQPETLAATLGGANAEPAGAVTEEVSAIMSGGKNQLGCIARTATMVWTSAPPTGYDPRGRVTIPIMTPALYNSLVKNVTTGNYLGADVRVVGLSPERRN